jgi:hypothetical protein
VSASSGSSAGPGRLKWQVARASARAPSASPCPDHLTPSVPVPASTPAATTDDNQLIAERREKLKALRAAQAEGKGVAFPNDFKPGHRAAALIEAHGATSPKHWKRSPSP